jgi:hypothetical protein
MEKIISLFQRNYDGDRLVRDEVVPGAEWVTAGEGVATRKWDGTCCLVKEGKLYKRYDAKHGKPAPQGFMPAQEPDPVTGHWPGWLAVTDCSPADQWHREAFLIPFPDGTYELCGPKVQGNPERFASHTLVPHGQWELKDAPRSFQALKHYLAASDYEGIVWHHPDGRMVKIKAKDFGVKRMSHDS